ncbi:hypothetical protein ACMHYB_21225 [Sorangium sp. So ce1128]
MLYAEGVFPASRAAALKHTSLLHEIEQGSYREDFARPSDPAR